MAADKFLCRACRKPVTGTTRNRYRTHSDGAGEPCENSGELIPEDLMEQGGETGPADTPKEGIDFATCPQCDRKVTLTNLGYFEPHNQTLKGGDRCPVSGVRAKLARKVKDVPLPGDKIPEEGLYQAQVPAVTNQEEVMTEPAKSNLERQPMKELTSAPAASSGASTESSSPESSTTSNTSLGSSPPSEQPGASSMKAFQLAPNLDDKILQPFSHIFQPFPVPDRIKLAESMDEQGKVLAARIKEIFYAYTNRNSSDNRGFQKTLGPSEIGSPCDRRLVMKLVGCEPVNPQEGWAPFVGTAVHAELAKMFEWANGSGSGRFSTEVSLDLGSTVVPRGTADLLDRVLFMVDDHKLLGRYSLDKLIQEGPSETYRIQAHVYGLGAERAGEKVRYVAIIGWPRQESSLDKLYVHVEKYDRKIAEAAIRRVEGLAEAAFRMGQGPFTKLQVAQEFGAADDCKWCPFYLRSDKGFTRGCPGK